MNPVILVARRGDGGHRDELWRYARAWWQDLLPGVPIVEGFHAGPEPFSFSKAINAAYRTAVSELDFDVCVYAGADWLAAQPRSVWQACTVAYAQSNLTFPHDHTAVLTEQGTRRVLGGAALADELRDAAWHTNTFSGIVAVARTAWETVGGFDERFTAWGFEDLCLWYACTALCGYDRVQGDLIHLWHPTDRTEREDNPNHGAQSVLWGRYRDVKTNPDGMRALLSEPGGPLAVTPA